MSNHDRQASRPPHDDAALDRAWRDASDEQPPAQLDVAIIAAARNTVPDGGDQPGAVPVRGRSRTWLARWQPVAAAATVAGLAFVLVQTLPRDHDLAPPLQHNESISTPASAETLPRAGPASQAATTHSPPAVPPAAPAPPVVAGQPSTTPGAATATDFAAPVGSAASSVAEASPESADTADSAGNRQAAKSEMARQAESSAVAASSGPGRERNLGLAAPRDPLDWAASIEAQYLAGNITDAVDALRAFRAADPDADRYLAESLREWALTVE